MADFYFSSPIFAKTPAELAAERKALSEAPFHDPDMGLLTSSWAERLLSGATQSLLGSSTYQAVEGVYDSLSGESDDPLNLETDVDQIDANSPASFSMGNNRTGIIEKLNTIPQDEWQYALAARTYNEFLDRVEFIKRGTPEAQPSALGLATGMVADAGAMMLGGMLAEPIALAGLGTRTTLAGRAASLTYGRLGVQTVGTASRTAEAAAEAAATLSRTGLAARWAALGAGEEVVYAMAREGIDPNYDPTFGELAFSMTLSAGIAGGLGGAAFGRTFAADQIQDAAESMYRARQVDLPGGYTINYTPFPFQSAAYVDETVLRGTAAQATSGMIDTAAAAAKAEWDALPQNLFEPQVIPTPVAPAVTRQVAEEIPVSQPTETLAQIRQQQQENWLKSDVMVRPDDPRWEQARPFGAFPTLTSTGRPRFEGEVTQANLSEIVPSGRTVYHETSLDNVKSLLNRLLAGDRRFDPPFYVSDNIDLAQGQGGKGYILELDPKFVNGVKNTNKVLEFAESQGVGTEFIVDKSTKKSVLSITVPDVEALMVLRDDSRFSKIFDFATAVRTERGIKINRRVAAVKETVDEVVEAAPTPKQAPIAAPQQALPTTPPKIKYTGRNPVMAAAFEVSLATGTQPTVQTFAAITRAMAAAQRAGGYGFGFNSVFWKELSRELGPEIAEKLRPQGTRAVIQKADPRAVAVAERGELVDQVWKYFNTGRYGADPAAPQSLIFVVLEEIRTRGGTVNRQVVSEVIDELQAIAKNPPTRVNTKGRTVLDPAGRRAAVINIINNRVGDLAAGSARTQGRAAGRTRKPVSIPESVLAKLGSRTTPRAAQAATGEAVMAGGAEGTPATPTAGNGTWDNVAPKQLTAFLTERIPLLSPLLNQAARAMESDNPAIRHIASLAFNARRSVGKAIKYTIFEEGTQLLHASMFSFLRGYRNTYLRFASGGGVNNVAADSVSLVDNLRFAFGNKAVRQDFNKRVAKQLRTGAFDDSVDAVNDAARGFQEIFQKVHGLAFEVGLPGFTKSAVRNYMPRMWRFDLIRDIANTPEGTQVLERLIKQAIDKNGRRVVIDGVEEVFEGDSAAAAKAFTDRLISIAKNTENRPMSSQDQELVEALGDLLGPLKAKVGSKTPFGRSRILLDENTEIVVGKDLLGNGKATLALDDLFDDDLPKVFRKYITSVMGAINERKLINAYNDALAANGFKGPKQILEDGTEIQEALKVNTIDEMLANARATGGDISEQTESALKEVIAALRYEPIYSGAPKFGDKAMSLFMQYGYLTTGGQFGLAAFSEIARIVGTVGLRNTIRQMPIIMEMLQNYKNLDRETSNFASFLDQWFHPSTDRMRRVFMDPLGDASYSGPFAGAVRGATNAMSDISGLAPINSMTQQLTAATTIQHLFEVGRKMGTKGLDDATVRTLGLEPDQYRALAKWVADNAETRAGLLGDRVVNLKNMDGPQMRELKQFVDRMVRTRIQDVPTRGDFAKFAFTWWGRLFTQFSTFNLKGIDNFLIQNAGRVKGGGGLQVAKEMTATMVLAGLIGWGRNKADYESYKKAGNYKKAEQMEELLSVEGFVRGAFSGPAEMYLLTKAGDAMWSLGSKDPLFAPYRYSGLDWYGFPGQSIFRNLGTVVNDARGALIGKPLGLDIEREITTKTIHAGRGLMPGQNLPFLKQYLNILEEDVAYEYNLRRSQPRSSN